MKKDTYPYFLTDDEQSVIESLIPESTKLGRPPRYGKRRVLAAVLYLVKSGIA